MVVIGRAHAGTETGGSREVVVIRRAHAGTETKRQITIQAHNLQSYRRARLSLKALKHQKEQREKTIQEDKP